jgi:hypothetical protein
MPDGNRRVNCEVMVPKELIHGQFANAFRILPDGQEFLLDFLVYTQQEDSAVLVARIRVQESLIQAVRERLMADMKEVGPRVGMYLAKNNGEIH